MKTPRAMGDMAGMEFSLQIKTVEGFDELA